MSTRDLPPLLYDHTAALIERLARRSPAAALLATTADRYSEHTVPSLLVGLDALAQVVVARQPYLLQPGECAVGILRGRGAPYQDDATWLLEPLDHPGGSLPLPMLWLRSGSSLLDRMLSAMPRLPVRIYRRRRSAQGGRPDYNLLPIADRPHPLLPPTEEG